MGTGFGQKTKRPRQQWLARGRWETLNLVLRVQAQVTSAREACDSGDNKTDSAYHDDTYRQRENQFEKPEPCAGSSSGDRGMGLSERRFLIGSGHRKG